MVSTVSMMNLASACRPLIPESDAIKNAASEAPSS